MEEPSIVTPVEDIIQTPEPESQPTRRVSPDTSDIPAEIVVKQFIIEGNSVFTSEELEEEFTDIIDKPISLSELLEVSSKITERYNEAGYVTSGAYISSDETFEDGIVTINIVEGDLETVNIAGLKGLNPGYVRSRLGIKPDEPLNVDELITNLQLLQLDPQVNSLSAELETGNKLGSSVLNVGIEPADSFNAFAKFDNGRSPSVGSFRRGFQLQDTSLLGFGDPLNLAYFNTEGSDEITLDYTLPLNARNSTIGFNFSNSWNNISEEPFNELDIQSNYQLFGFTFRQPIIRSLKQDLALGLSLDRQRSKTSVDGRDFALSTGADEDGETRITALRFFQEWLKRDQKQVFGFRSQFNVGLGLFNATNNDDEDIPDSQFFSWQGQAQWARQLGTDSLFLFNVNSQLAPQSLVPLEQLGIGGVGTVRGYRQNLLLTDNGVIASAEVRLPILKIRRLGSVVKLAPFFDYGVGWNSGVDITPESNNIASVGVGLIYELGNSFSARLDYGKSLTDVENRGDSWQENGILFSITSQPF